MLEAAPALCAFTTVRDSMAQAGEKSACLLPRKGMLEVETSTGGYPQ